MSSFGEIVEPTSRNVWEDWDETATNIDRPASDSELHWKTNVQVPKEIESLFILEGKYLFDCIKQQKDYILDLVDAIPEVTLNLYRVEKSKKYVCTVRDYSLIMSSEIVELLKKYIDISDNVISIQTKPLPEYQTTKLASQDCVIRKVSTSKGLPININYPKLEQPNIICGVSAGVITLREHLGLNGAAIICYMDHLEEYGVEEIQKLLDELDIVKNIKIGTSSILDSNLYV